ncbi:hypothetical protein ACX80R_18335, partial [Paeniglutamicibacter antarcticus]
MPDEWRSPERDSWSEKFHSEISAIEGSKTRTAVAKYDTPPPKRLKVTGAGALVQRQALSTGNIAKEPGAVTYFLLLNPDGGIRSDVTIAWLGQDHFQLGINSNIDLDYFTVQAWLAARRDLAAWANVLDVTGASCWTGLWCPLAREVMVKVGDDDFDNEALKYFRTNQVVIGAYRSPRRACPTWASSDRNSMPARKQGRNSGTGYSPPAGSTGSLPLVEGCSIPCAWRRATGSGAPTCPPRYLLTSPLNGLIEEELGLLACRSRHDSLPLFFHD